MDVVCLKTSQVILSVHKYATFSMCLTLIFFNRKVSVLFKKRGALAFDFAKTQIFPDSVFWLAHESKRHTVQQIRRKVYKTVLGYYVKNTFSELNYFHDRNWD